MLTRVDLRTDAHCYISPLGMRGGFFHYSNQRVMLNVRLLSSLLSL
jgi:hypothetical protein